MNGNGGFPGSSGKSEVGGHLRRSVVGASFVIEKRHGDGIDEFGGLY